MSHSLPPATSPMGYTCATSLGFSVLVGEFQTSFFLRQS